MRMLSNPGLRKRGAKTLGVALLLALLTLSAGCGSKELVSTAPKLDTPPTKTTPAKKLFKLRYRMKWLHQAQFAGALVAKEKGFYAQRGLDVEILSGGGDNPPYPSLIEGSADISNLNLITALKYHVTDHPLVCLAQISQKSSTVLVGKKTSGIKTIKDLEGKKIGVWRDGGGDHVRFFLESLGMNIRVIPIDWSVNLLLNDAIDMMNAMVYNEYNRILMSGLREEDLVAFDLADYGFDLAEDGLYATKEFYERHEQQCHDFAAATLEGWIYAQSHKGETLDVVMRYLRENHLPANREHQAWMLDHMISKIMEDPNRVGQLELQDFDLAQKILMDRGLLANPVGYKSFFPHEN